MFRRDHDYEWERNNQILRDGELVAVYTALGTKYKQGDGKKPFIELQYISNINSLLLFLIIHIFAYIENKTSINRKPTIKKQKTKE